jgi:hypothetical protein
MSRQSELDVLLERASRRGYAWHRFRDDRHGPEVLAGVFGWDNCTDVLVLTDEKGTHAYRTPIAPTVDVFAPTHVHWWYGRSDDAVLPGTGQVLRGVSMVWVLRALLTLPDPGEPGGLPAVMPAPKGTGVSGERVPVRIRRWLGH